MKPLLLEIYESKECEGVLAPYIVKNEINELIKTILEKQKSLLNVLDNIPDMTTIRGGVSYDMITPQRRYSGSTLGTNNLSFDAQENNKPGVLPPHKVTYDKNGNMNFESNIYTPCCHDPSDHQLLSQNNSESVFQTGSYPNEPAVYPSINDVLNPQNESAKISCNCHKHDYKINSKDKLTLTDKLINNWISGIQDIQISNLISSLVQSNKIPMNPGLITTLSIILKKVLSCNDEQSILAQAVGHITQIGVLTKTVNTISSPHNKCYFTPFITVCSDQEKAYVANIIMTALKEYPNSYSVLLVTVKEFEEIRQYYPINVCFDCSLTRYATNDIQTMEMTLVNKNQFVPNVRMVFNADNKIINILGPSSIMEVPAGTSGSVSFVVGDRYGSNAYDIDKIYVNRHMYTISELTDKEHPIREFEYSQLSATIEEGEHNERKLTIYYSGISSDITVFFDVIKILNDNEIVIDEQNVETLTHRILPTNLTTKSSSLYTEEEQTESSEKTDDEKSDTNTDESSENENDQNSYSLYVNLTVPFTYPVADIRNSNLIHVYEIIRDFDEDGVCSNIEFKEDPLFAKRLVSVTTATDSLTREKSLEIEKALINKNSEYEIVIDQGALLTNYTDHGVTLSCTTHKMSLHFAVDFDREWIEILGKDDIPKYIKDSLNKKAEDSEEINSETPSQVDGSVEDNTETPEDDSMSEEDSEVPNI